MQFIGGPVTVQNTDQGHWLVTLQDAVTSTAGEAISLTVAVRADPAATMPQLQRRAALNAIAQLQALADRLAPG